MLLPKIDPTATKSWQMLADHYKTIQSRHLTKLFADDPNRAETFGLQWQDVYVDFSKNKVTEKTLDLLYGLANEVELKKAITGLFSGERINETENRSVLHTALRDFDAMKPEVVTALAKMKQFSEELHSGKRCGYSGKKITDVVNIGIGGSHLGPDMVCTALQNYSKHVRVHFISNIDGDHVQTILDTIQAETTLFIIVSKSFSTQETLTNARAVKKWFVNQATPDAVLSHFVAVSASPEKVRDFGIAPENTFPMWDWVGGRFSLWGAAGLSICCAIGYDNYERLLQGAHEVDTHFKTAPFAKNIPVTLGLLSVWYNNFFKAETQAVIPYAEALQKLVPYLQQAFMESNGKGTDRNGRPVTYDTGSIVWGTTGTNAQHAFFQLLHQGTKLIPTEFICFKDSFYKNEENHSLLLTNCLAQSEALMNGKSNTTDKHRHFSGDKPSTTILFQSLSPINLGKLLALYEHKLFVEGIVWNIFSYDQWGVELGKEIAASIAANWDKTSQSEKISPSTQILMQKINGKN